METTKAKQEMLTKKLVATALSEFLKVMILICSIEIAYYYLGSLIVMEIGNIDLEWLYLLKAAVITVLLGRLTLTFAEYRETRSVMLNPEKELNITVSLVLFALLYICILPLGYLIASYTMATNSIWQFLLLVAFIYIICSVRVGLAITTRFYQQMLLNYYKNLNETGEE